VSETILEHGYIPEEHAPDPVVSHGDPTAPGKVAIWLFLASEIMFFIAILGTYIILRSGSPELFKKFAGVLSKQLGALNTGVLILSSLALHWAQVAARRGEIDGVRTGLLAGGASILAFLAGQLLAWKQLTAAGYYLTTNPANSFFYLLTAAHGLHLLGGLVALGRTAARAWLGFEMEQVRLSVELCAMYWHFLLLVWLVLFGLLLHG